MIFAQFALLYVCLLYRPQLGDGIVDPGTLQDQDTSSSLLPGPSASSSARIPRLSRRPFDLWQWASFGMYVEFTALLVVIHCGMFFVLYGIIRSKTYVGILGFLALGLEATLPIPQLLVNFQRKSTAGFRHSVLASWVGGVSDGSVNVSLDAPLTVKTCTPGCHQDNLLLRNRQQQPCLQSVCHLPIVCRHFAVLPDIQLPGANGSRPSFGSGSDPEGRPGRCWGRDVMESRTPEPRFV